MLVHAAPSARPEFASLSHCHLTALFYAIPNPTFTKTPSSVTPKPTMPRTDEAAAFFHAVYSAISEIPAGRVTSYGHIAMLIGTPQRPRQVGVCLKHLPDDPSAQWNHDSVPWQRVVNAKGVISPRNHPTAVRTQADLLREEGVEVTSGGLGELSVDLSEYGWFPSVLPSEADAPVKEEENSE